MVDAIRSSVSGRGLAALGRVARTPPMPAASKAAWTREADGLAGRPPGRQVRPGAAQTRQTAPRAREIVASPIYLPNVVCELERLVARHVCLEPEEERPAVPEEHIPREVRSLVVDLAARVPEHHEVVVPGQEE